MADIEKVIKGLEHCTRPSEIGKGGNFCMDCPYVEPIGFNQFKCNGEQMKKDAIELLKDQRQQIWELQDLTEHLKDKLKEKKKPIEDFGMFAYKKHFRGELNAENLAFLNLWISKYMEQT